MRTLLAVMFVLSVSFVCLGATTTTTLVPAVASTVTAEATPKIIEVLHQVDDKIPSIPPAGFILIAGLILELVVRIKPTAKPASILLAISTVLSLLASIFVKTSNALDSVVQNVKATK